MTRAIAVRFFYAINGFNLVIISATCCLVASVSACSAPKPVERAAPE
ncbi:hypothetical protein [Psychrobacter lutiphocae]|nr:hypothetical protein [Psychrobacter lutiphocae]